MRLLYVDAAVRGMGLGRRLVEECIRFARAGGYRRMVLWTNDVLVSARRICEAAGFTLLEQERHHRFGKDLTGRYGAAICETRGHVAAPGQAPALQVRRRSRRTRSALNPAHAAASIPHVTA